MEAHKTSWGLQTCGAFKHTLVIRKDAVIERMKREQEREQKRVKSAAERAKNFWTGIKTWSGYLVIFLVALVFIGPPVLMTYIKNEIAVGEWTHLEQAPADIVEPEVFEEPEEMGGKWDPRKVDVRS